MTICALFLITPSGVAAPAVIKTRLDMDVDPVQLGWTVSQQGNGTHTLSDGILTIQSATFYELKAPSSVWWSKVNNAVGWEVETRVRQRSAGFSNLVLWMHDLTYVTKVELRDNEFRLHLGDTRYEFAHYLPLDVHVYHTYRFRTQGGAFDIFVDGNHIYSTTRIGRLSGGGGTVSFFFGDGWWSGATLSDWDYFQITLLPEPGAALVLPALLLLSRRRVRARHG